MKKILIATKNRDKFDVATKILSKINGTEYEYYSLYDVQNIEKDSNEIGTVQERAYKKAKQVYSELNDNMFEYIIGIDDGIKMKGILRTNVKHYMEKIINDEILSEGEKIEIVRAYCIMNQSGDYKTVTTEIPFEYKKYDEEIKIKENSYPLNNVLKPIGFNEVVAKLDKDTCNEYYLKYSEAAIEEAFK